jgi:hypothetical protein
MTQYCCFGDAATGLDERRAQDDERRQPTHRDKTAMNGAPARSGYAGSRVRLT